MIVHHIDAGEVFEACKQLGFKGEVRPLWAALDVYGEGVARLENIDFRTAEVRPPGSDERTKFM